MITILIHDTDQDGLASAALYLSYNNLIHNAESYKLIPFHFDPDQIQHDIKRTISDIISDSSFGMDNSIAMDIKLVYVDCSPFALKNKGVVEFLQDCVDKYHVKSIEVFDHHYTSYGKYLKENTFDLPIIYHYNEEHSAAWIVAAVTFGKMNDETFCTANKPFKNWRLWDYVSDYDVWSHFNSDSKPFNYGNKMMYRDDAEGIEYYRGFIEAFGESFEEKKAKAVKIGENIISRNLTKIKKQLENLELVDTRYGKAYILVKERDTLINESSEYLLKTNNYCKFVIYISLIEVDWKKGKRFGIFKKPKTKYVLSFRSNKGDTVNVGWVAKTYFKGGGHQSAAGAIIDDLSKLYKLLK